jgi:hypothetical protein
LVEIGDEGDSNHALGYCHRIEEEDVAGEKRVRLVCATLIFTARDQIGVFTTYSFPAQLLRKVEDFRPRKGSAFGSLLARFKALVEGGEMKKVVKVWTPTYVAEAEEFSYIWEEVDRKAVGIRLYNAHVKYTDCREEFLNTLDVHLRPNSGICWGIKEVRGDEE